MGMNATAGKVAYAALFCLALPALLWAWTRSTQLLATWPLPRPPGAGLVLLAAGMALMLAGMHALWRFGDGLPMNAFPPRHFVARGPYHILAHPIYAGFAAACFGAAFAAGDAAGVYLVAPVATAGAVALVLGYEGPALRARFPEVVHRPWLSLPSPHEALLPRDRWSVLLLVLLPWLALYLWVVELGPARDAVQPWLRGERQWPVYETTYAVYASAYFVVGTAPFWARGAHALTDFARGGLAAIALHTFLYLVVPIAAPPRSFVPTTWLGEWLAWEGRREASGAGALPSFHTTWALLTAALLARSVPRVAPLAWLWGLAVAASCVTTGMHATADVVAGVMTFALVYHRGAVWQGLRRWAEWTANSMRTWRLGPLRVFVHALYAGPAAAVVAWTMTRWVGEHELAYVVFVCVGALLGAAAWAQWIEGAAVSLRPFGYYGAVLGGAAAVACLPAFGIAPWPFAGSLCLAAPWAQAIGRLRCLVQGCCHGRPAPAHLGIVTTHPLSRVVRLANASGVPLHATQLYSLLWNVPCGLVLLRAAALGQPPTVVAGLYLVLNGLGRFVEEGCRGEPQARHWGGLVEYQYYAIASVVAGAVVTCVPSAWPATSGLGGDSLGALAVTAAIGLFTAFAMGIDFPTSNRRFARLLK